MISLGDWDNDGDEKFDWVLFRNQNGTDQVYKLGGVNSSGNFVYEKVDNLKAVFSGDSVEFKEN